MNENWIKTFTGLRKRVESSSFLDKVFTSDLTNFVDWPASASSVIIESPKLVIANPTSSLEVLFLSDYIREKNSSETEVLIKKIAEAMKLTESDYQFIYFIEEKFDKKIDMTTLMDKNYTQLENKIINLNPKVVITLGSTVTNYLLKENLRLVSIHGKFLDLTLKNFETKMVPIFHPEYLMVNPAMKKTVWDDLQKIMKFLGKN